MYNKAEIERLVLFIRVRDGIANKDRLTEEVQAEFSLVKDRSVYSGKYFAIRFCKSKSDSFYNTVLSLSALQKYDDQPFIVCLVIEPYANCSGNCMIIPFIIISAISRTCSSF